MKTVLVISLVVTLLASVVSFILPRELLEPVKPRGHELSLSAEAAAVLEEEYGGVGVESGPMASPGAAAGVSAAQLTGRQAFTDLLYHFDGFAGEPSAKSITFDAKHASDERVWTVSRDAALREIDLLFDTLRYGYAGYQLAGGDEAFGAARQRAADEVKARGADIEMWDYEAILRDALSHIKDDHFFVGNFNVSSDLVFRYDPYHEFVLGDDGQYVGADGQALAAISGGAPGAMLVPSISAEGRIVYIPGRFGKDDNADLDEVLIELEYVNGGIEMAWLVPMRAATFGGTAGIEHDNIYTVDRSGDFPVVTLRAFGPTGESDSVMMKFVLDGARLRGERVFVLDLRGNRGGLDAYGYEWLAMVAGATVGSGAYMGQLTTATASVLISNAVAINEKEGLDVDRMKSMARRLPSQADPARPGWARIEYDMGIAGPVETPWMVVLVDKGTASASESLLRRMRALPRTVIIGSNTTGALLSGNAGALILPVSGLSVYIPTMLWLGNDLASIDATGFAPDFWVEPELAVERAEAFIKAHLKQQGK